MKDYLNAKEREEWFKTFAAYQAVCDVIESQVSHKPKEMIADLRRAKAFLDRAIAKWVEPLSPKAREVIYKQGLGLTIMIANDARKKAAHVEFLRHMKQVREEAYAEGKDYVYDLAEVAMYGTCRICDGKVRDECRVYEALRNLYVEPWDPKHPKCEYAGAGEVNAG